MAKQGKIMDGKDIFYTKLSLYLHIFKNRTQENLAARFGVPRSTVQGWVKEFNRSRLESILKNFKLETVPDYEGLRTEDCDIEEIRRMLVRQAEAGSTAAAKLLLDMEREAPTKPGEEQLTVEQAARLIREWHGPRRCSRCGNVDHYGFEDRKWSAESPKEQKPMTILLRS